MKNFLVVLLVFAVLAAGVYVFAGRDAWDIGAADTAGKPEKNITAEALEAEMKNMGKPAELFEVLKAQFPDEYNAFLAQAADSLNKGASFSESKREGFLFMRSITQKYMDKLILAPDAEMAAFVSSQNALIKQLQREDQQQCADFGMRGFKEDVVLSPQSMDLAAATGIAQINGIRAGIDNPTPREAASPEDWKVVFQAMMQQGAKQEDIQRLATAATVPLTTEQECSISVQMFAAIETLPQALRGKVFATMLRHLPQ